eukprot:CAMPEP_0197415706 /NCGR_PEP_ID=MMETSP1170-20131217/2162_1 /TAXON_ID=54406 /ORGANISM="Sarcinochrysis sp, Strain CCMP770" /LENGTH=327 /DNA_ID=CAMNT_0042942537 /DNA_START=335 /DNA_END=1317 /DNA_ORIENTATION=-
MTPIDVLSTSGGEKLITLLLGDVSVKGDVDTMSLANDNSCRSTKGKRAVVKQPFKADDVEEATKICMAMLREGYIHRSTRTGRGQLEYAECQKWDAAASYVWDFEGSKRFNHLLTGLLIVGMLAVTCFPIWPHVLKVYLWYCSVSLLIMMIAFIFVRGTLFLCLWILGYEFWLFPNLFDESLSVLDSFKPTVSFEHGAPGQRYYRSAVVAAMAAFFVYCYNQPTDFDAFVAAQREFVSDLYEGKLLTDTSQQAKDDIDKIKRPSFEELAMEEEAELRERAARVEIEDIHLSSASNIDDYASGSTRDPDDDDILAQSLIDSMLNELSD